MSKYQLEIPIIQNIAINTRSTHESLRHGSEIFLLAMFSNVVHALINLQIFYNYNFNMYKKIYNQRRLFLCHVSTYKLRINMSCTKILLNFHI